jgi:hypothetical protein
MLFFFLLCLLLADADIDTSLCYVWQEFGGEVGQGPAYCSGPEVQYGIEACRLDGGACTFFLVYLIHSVHGMAFWRR